jgi:uncharacterized protein YfaS (alpha-2-macroglobulin family)
MKIYFSEVVVILAMLLIFSCVSSAAKDLIGAIEGNVYSAETNQPIYYALIKLERLHPKKPPVRMDGATDAAGKFLAPIYAGTYKYTVAAPGFALFEGEIAVTAEAPVKLSVPLNREAVIRGRIVDPSGTPLQGIEVSVGKELRSVTDGNGEFQIPRMDARGYEVRIRHSRWVGEKPLFVSLEAGEKRDLGDITARRSGTLTIKLVAGKKGFLRGLGRADIYLSGEVGNRWGRTDNNGQITFAALPPGFYSIDSYDERIVDPHMNVEVKEGTRSVLKLEAALRPPSLAFENTDLVFLPSSPVKLQLRGLWLDKARVTLYSVDLDRFREGRVDIDKPDAISPTLFAKEQAFSVTLRKQRGIHSKKAAVSLPSLRPGIYVVDAASGKTATRNLFLVTRLGIVAKTSPTWTLFYAVDLVGGKALPGAEVKAFPPDLQDSGDSGFSAKTDANGLAEYDGPQRSVKIIAFKDGNPASLNLTRNPEEGRKAELRSYLYTDRPVYRPGQTVYFKGIVRKMVGEEYALPKLDKIRVTIVDSQDQSVFKRDYAVNSLGSFNGEFTLANSPSLGDYTLRAEAGQQKWQTFFSVREYRKPEFEVTLNSPHTFRVAGETEDLSLQARYYFGAPVEGAKVRYRIYSRHAYAAFPGDQEPSGPADVDEDGDYAAGYSDFLGEGEAVTDEKGQAKITVSTGHTDIPLTYIVEADVTDIASRQISASTRFLVTPSLVALDIRSHSYLAAPGKPVEFSARTRTWEGKPVKTRVSIEIEEQIYDKRTHITSFRKMENMNIETDAAGQAKFRYTFPHPGHWRVTAQAADEQGRKSTAHDWIWVWQEGHAWESSYRELEVEFDKQSYKPGETARLIVRNPAAGASLLLTLEGREIYRKRVMGSAGSVEVVDIPVLTEYAPYVFVSTTVVNNGHFYTMTKMLRVDHQAHRLDVTIDPDKSVYAPGDTVHLAVTTTDPEEAKPRSAELSLAVVDEAIYAVSPEKSEDIYRFFRGTREHLVMTLNSFPRIYLGGAPKAEAAAPASEELLKGIKVRKVFKDTAFWMPILETDARARAAAGFVLPDNLTTWRVTAVGHTAESDFGTGRVKFVSRLDVMARLQPPRFFIQGDELKIPAVVNNMTAHAIEVTGSFEAKGLTLQGEGRFSGEIKAGGSMRRDFAVKAGSPGLHLIRLRAAAGDRGDAMELEVPVLPRAMARESRGNIALRGTVGETSVEFPREALKERSSLNIEISPTLAASLGESIGALVNYPYGCVEQTMSSFLPAVYVRNLLGSGRFSLEKDVAEKLPKVLDKGLKRLYDFQHGDGGWGWWKEDPSDPYMTAYVVYGLTLAQKSGVKVNRDVLDSGLNALQELAKKTSVNSLPYVYRSLTLSARTDPSLEKKIEAAWRQLQPSERVYYVDALLNIGQKERADKVLADLKEHVKHEGSAAYLQDDDALSWWYSWRWSGSTVETTAMLLETVLVDNPADPLAPSLAEFLVRKRSGRWWNTTRGTAIVVKALSDYVAATGESDASYTASLMLNGRELERIAVKKGKIVKGITSLTVPSAGLKRGANKLQLVKSAPEGALYLTAVLDYHVPPELASQSPGLSVERKIYHIKTRKEGKEWRLEYLPLHPGENLSPGDEIEVRLIVDNKDDMNFVIIEDRLPSGFEVRETKSDLRFVGLNDYWDWYVHSERHDERMAFFLDNLPKGRHEFRYVMYPELEGNVLALPASVWPMYVPSLKSESKPWEVKVVK